MSMGPGWPLLSNYLHADEVAQADAIGLGAPEAMEDVQPAADNIGHGAPDAMEDVQPAADGSGGGFASFQRESAASEEAAGEDPGDALPAVDDEFMEEVDPAAVPPPAPSDEEDFDIEELLDE